MIFTDKDKDPNLFIAKTPSLGTVKFREVPLTALIDSTGDICGLQSVRAAEIKIKSHQMESIKLNQFYHLTANISAKLTIFISSFYRLTATECQK